MAKIFGISKGPSWKTVKWFPSKLIFSILFSLLIERPSYTANEAGVTDSGTRLLLLQAVHPGRSPIAHGSESLRLEEFDTLLHNLPTNLGISTINANRFWKDGRPYMYNNGSNDNGSNDAQLIKYRYSNNLVYGLHSRSLNIIYSIFDLTIFGFKDLRLSLKPKPQFP